MGAGNHTDCKDGFAKKGARNMNFRKSGKLMWTGGIVSAIIIMLGLFIKNDTASLVLVVLGVVIYLAAMIQAFVFYKCPHCGFRLRKAHTDVPKRCPDCNEVLPE